MVHEWAENFVKGNKPEVPTDEKVLNGVSAFLDWAKKNEVRFVSSERVVYSKKHNFIGMMDAEAEIDGKLCVVDFKTSSGLYPEHSVQTAAYQLAAEEEGSQYSGERWVARFDKETGEFEAKQCHNYENDNEVFLSLLKVKKLLVK